ncbi:MAG: PsbP-related protein [Pleurocapsa sp. MO_226.B13]|nr:PsbP-related protein [Pleurocapsa sp. MO_226.B13]
MESIVGKILCDRYRVIEELSHDDFSTIFSAEDLEPPARSQCQIERIQPQYDSEVLGAKSWQKVLQTFISQGKLLKNISQHPQIPRLLAFFECDREFYLVREAIVGQSLEERLKHSLLSEAEAIEWLQEILGVLDFIHQANINHLNIQPSSLIEQQDGKKFLTNFSTIKNAILLNNQTTNTIIANDNFFPLEQQAGKPTSSTDIYALGKTIIYALTGKIGDRIQSQPSPSSQKSESSETSNFSVAKIGPELAKILNKMVDEHPKRRYQSATEVLDDLDFSQKVITLPPPMFGNFQPSVNTANRVENYADIKVTRNDAKTKQKLIWSLLTLPFIIALGFMFIGINKNAYKQFTTYVNNDYQFQIKYPQNWSRRELEDPITGEVVVFSSPLETNTDSFSEKVYITVEYLPSESTTLEEYTQTVFERIEQAKGNEIEVHQDRKTRISQSPARLVIYSRQEGTIQLRQMEAFTIKKDRVYVAIYIAERAKFSKFLDKAQKMIDSWEIQ